MAASTEANHGAGRMSAPRFGDLTEHEARLALAQIETIQSMLLAQHPDSAPGGTLLDVQLPGTPIVDKPSSAVPAKTPHTSTPRPGELTPLGTRPLLRAMPTPQPVGSPPRRDGRFSAAEVRHLRELLAEESSAAPGWTARQGQTGWQSRAGSQPDARVGRSPIARTSRRAHSSPFTAWTTFHGTASPQGQVVPSRPCAAPSLCPPCTATPPVASSRPHTTRLLSCLAPGPAPLSVRDHGRARPSPHRARDAAAACTSREPRAACVAPEREHAVKSQRNRRNGDQVCPQPRVFPRHGPLPRLGRGPQGRARRLLEKWTGHHHKCKGRAHVGSNRDVKQEEGKFALAQEGC
jgi:hypothetical protein